MILQCSGEVWHRTWGVERCDRIAKYNLKRLPWCARCAKRRGRIKLLKGN